MKFSIATVQQIAQNIGRDVDLSAMGQTQIVQAAYELGMVLAFNRCERICRHRPSTADTPEDCAEDIKAAREAMGFR